MTIINNRSLMFSGSIWSDMLIQESELGEQGQRPHFISQLHDRKGTWGDKSKGLGFGTLGYKEFSLAQVQSEYWSTFGRNPSFLKEEEGNWCEVLCQAALL